MKSFGVAPDQYPVLQVAVSQLPPSVIHSSVRNTSQTQIAFLGLDGSTVQRLLRHHVQGVPLGHRRTFLPCLNCSSENAEYTVRMPLASVLGWIVLHGAEDMLAPSSTAQKQIALVGCLFRAEGNGENGGRRGKQATREDQLDKAHKGGLALCSRNGLMVLPSFPPLFDYLIAGVSRLLPQRSTATSQLYRPCRSSQSLHSSFLIARSARFPPFSSEKSQLNCRCEHGERNSGGASKAVARGRGKDPRMDRRLPRRPA